MTGEATTVVVHENTAASVGAGGVEVFGTPMMIGLMEMASWLAVDKHLDEGYVSVGVLVNVRHRTACAGDGATGGDRWQAAGV